MAIQNSLSVAQVQARSSVAYRSYTVKPGDTLSGIARTQLGDANRWHEIYNLNKTVIGSNPNLIKPGQVLRLPPRSATPSPTPTPAPTPTPTPAPRPMPGDSLDLPGAIRVGSPLLAKVGTWIADKLGMGGGAANGGIGGGFFDPGAGGSVPGDIGGGSVPGDIGGGGVPGEIGGGDFGSGGTIGADEGFAGGISGGAGGAVSNAFQSLKNAASAGFEAAVSGLKRNFLFAGITSAVTNGIAFATGKATGKQAVSGFVADTGAYTVIGSASTFAGAAIGTLIPIPFVGTAIGIAAGMGLGYLYEKLFRKNLTNNVQKAIFH
ncbi:MAG TPA: LysM peptidoglycan-binding domain-containing protein [Stenomitos sp.]